MTNEHWHLDKRLNIGHALTTLSALGAIVVWGTTIESRISVLETQASHSHQIQQDIKNEIIRLNNNIGAELVRMNVKIDRLIEREKR